MSIKRLVEAIDSDNLVDKVLAQERGEETLLKLGRRVCRNHELNEESMHDWSSLIEDGMDIAKAESKGASYPWDGAANFKSPLITEAVRAFGDKAKTEIMKSDTLVATKIVGQHEEDEQRKESAERISDHMNWQVNTEMKTWRDEHTRALYLLASQGAIFKKTFYDATEGCNKSSVVRYPNFSLNQECDNLYDSNFTETKYFWPNDIWSRQRAGLWVDGEIVPKGDSEDLEEENFEFLEQFCNFDLDDDGYEEPLIVTVHRQSEKVVRIVPCWDVESLHVMYNGNTYNLADLIKGATAPKTQDDEFNQIQAEEEISNIQSKSRLVRIVPMDILTYYGFIESTDGSFLGQGYLHLLGSTVKGINKGTNSLYNAGELSNLQGGWLSSEHREKKRGPFKTKAGAWKQTNITARNLGTSVYPFPFKEPSQTLFALVEKTESGVREMSSQFNYEKVLSPNVPAASVLGAIQEGIIPTSSLLMNVVNAMSKEFQILFTLNQKFTDPLIYQTITGSAEYTADYTQDIVIAPTANAQFSNQMQRIQLAQAQMDRIDLLLQVGGNPVPVIKSYYEALGTTNMDEIFPEQMTDEDAKQVEQMRQLQQQQVEAIQFQNQLLQGQVEQGNMEIERKTTESDAKIEEMARDADRKDVETGIKLEEQERKNAELALKVTELETQAGRELSAEVEDNKAVLTFDPAKGDFVDA